MCIYICIVNVYKHAYIYIEICIIDNMNAYIIASIDVHKVDSKKTRRTRAKPLDVAECYTQIVSGTLVYLLCSWWFLHTCRYHSVRGLVPHWLQVRHQLSAAHCGTRGWPGQSHARLLHDLELHGYCGGLLAHWPQVRPDATWFWKMLGGAVFAPWCCHC